jgi:hypothetical protein
MIKASVVHDMPYCVQETVHTHITIQNNCSHLKLNVRVYQKQEEVD